MGKPSQFPPGPITLQVEAGREAFRKLTKPFIRQTSQPKWLKLAEATLKDKVLHSTHLTGFSQGLLRDPGPKGFLALGLLNLAIAQGTCPEHLSGIWKGLKPMVHRSGSPLGPEDLFSVFVGLLDLGLEDVREIPLEKEAQVAKDLGRWFRRELALKNIDYVVEDAKRLHELSPTIESLLKGRTPHGDQIVEAIPLIAKELGLVEGEVWDVIQSSLV